MSWKQVASFLVLVFILLTLRAVLAGPIYAIESALLDLGSIQTEGLAQSDITGIIDQWFLMVLLAVFLLMGVAIARVVRKELTGRVNQ